MSLARIRRLPAPKTKPDYRIALRPDDEGELDDVFVKDVAMFRMERMDENYFWLACYFDNKAMERMTFRISAKRAHVGAYVEERPHGDEFTYEPGSM